MLNNFDAIIIGAGHNGLVTAGYLAKAGYKVAVFEARSVVGGCSVTEEVWPGYKISRLAYVNSLFRPEIVRDFKLEDHGYEMLPRSPSSFTPFLDGRSLLLGPDPELCQREISKFSKRDAKRYLEYEQLLTDISLILEPMLKMTPIDPNQASIWDISKYARFGLKSWPRLKKQWPELLRLMAGSARDFLDYWFESEELKVTLATDAVIGANAGPSTPGTGYILFHHVMGECNGVRGVWGYMRGGMGAVAYSLAQACRAMGVEIFTDSPVAEIMVDSKGRASGVSLKSGKQFNSRIVVSGADPKVTARLCGGALSSEFSSQVARINFDSAAVKINLALSELPNFKAIPGLTAAPHHRGTIHICPSMRYLEDAYADSVAGRPSASPILECSIPTVIDQTLAPPGKHIMNLFVQYGPYALREGLDWSTEREKFGDRCIETLSEYAPNIKGAIIHREVITPLDMEREFHITGGNILHGRMNLDQMFTMRPVPGASNYRFGLKGLYLCGAGAHPGGGVMGGPGQNAAREILKDLKKRVI